MVSAGGGIPQPLMPRFDKASVTDWEPLTKSINSLFDEPEPPTEKREWRHTSKTQDTLHGSTGCGGGWANPKSDEPMQQQATTGSAMGAGMQGRERTYGCMKGKCNG